MPKPVEQVVVLSRNVQPDEPPQHILELLAFYKKTHPHATVKRKEIPPKPDGVVQPDVFIIDWSWSGWSFFW